MRTQLWEADHVPEKAPLFVNPHITIDYDSTRKTRRYYLFEVDPHHETFFEVKDKVDLAKYILEKVGFKNPRHIITTERPDWLC